MGVRGEVNEAQLANSERIRRNQQRDLLNLVNDVLSFSRLETGEIPLTIVAMPLAQTVRPLSAVIEPQAAKRGIKCEFIGEQEVEVLGDRERVEQILINLLGNALKFTKEGGTVSMRCCQNDDVGMVDVSDTGIGILEAKLGIIFDPFVQVDANRGKRDGVGLGLAISRKLARAMGGDITVKSTEGAGSTFTLSLPLANR